MTDVAGAIDRIRPNRRTAFLTGLALNAEALLIILYLHGTTAAVTDPLILIYPFIWINVGVWAIVTTTPPLARRRQWLLAAGIGVSYFFLLAVVSGMVSPGHALHGHGHASGVRLVVSSIPPGWSPALFYGGAYVTVAVFPFRVVGYAALAYLVYTMVLDAAGSAFAGLVGLFSCVSCAWPIVGTIITGLFGSSSAVAAVATNQPYGASTVVFLSAIALLYWRPLR